MLLFTSCRRFLPKKLVGHLWKWAAMMEDEEGWSLWNKRTRISSKHGRIKRRVKHRGRWRMRWHTFGPFFVRLCVLITLVFYAWRGVRREAHGMLLRRRISFDFFYRNMTISWGVSRIVHRIIHRFNSSLDAFQKDLRMTQKIAII